MTQEHSHTTALREIEEFLKNNGGYEAGVKAISIAQQALAATSVPEQPSAKAEEQNLEEFVEAIYQWVHKHIAPANNQKVLELCYYIRKIWPARPL